MRHSKIRLFLYLFSPSRSPWLSRFFPGSFLPRIPHPSAAGNLHQSAARGSWQRGRCSYAIGGDGLTREHTSDILETLKTNGFKGEQEHAMAISTTVWRLGSEKRKQNKRDPSRASLGNEEENTINPFHNQPPTSLDNTKPSLGNTKPKLTAVHSDNNNAHYEFAHQQPHSPAVSDYFFSAVTH